MPPSGRVFNSSACHELTNKEKRNCGTPNDVSQHTNVPRHSGWELLIYNVQYVYILLILFFFTDVAEPQPHLPVTAMASKLSSEVLPSARPAPSAALHLRGAETLTVETGGSFLLKANLYSMYLQMAFF